VRGRAAEGLGNGSAARRSPRTSPSSASKRSGLRHRRMTTSHCPSTSLQGYRDGQVLITGGRGVIASALAPRLADRRLRLVDLPETDLRDPAVAREAVAGCEQVVRLAWNVKDEDFRSGT
jgi:hypothetical protein